MPQSGSKRVKVELAAFAVVFLFVGFLHEVTSHPIQPINFVPHLIFLSVGLAVAIAVGEAQWRREVQWLAFPVGLWVVFRQFQEATSFLPICLFIGVLCLVRFLLSLPILED